MVALIDNDVPVFCHEILHGMIPAQTLNEANIDNASSLDLAASDCPNLFNRKNQETSRAAPAIDRATDDDEQAQVC